MDIALQAFGTHNTLQALRRFFATPASFLAPLLLVQKRSQGKNAHLDLS